MAIFNRNIVDDYLVIMVMGSIVTKYKVYDATSLSNVVNQTLAGDGVQEYRLIVSSEADVTNIVNTELNGDPIEVEGGPGDIFDEMYISVLDGD